MINCNIRYRRIIPALLIAIGLGCFSLAPAARADDHHRSIVGLWRVHYFHDTTEIFQSFDQWHSDGQEFEVANLGPGQLCQGTFRQMGSGVQLFHVGWNYDQNGVLTGYFQETQTNTVDEGGNTYHGTWDIKNYDPSGNFLSEDMGRLTATRLPVH